MAEGRSVAWRLRCDVMGGAGLISVVGNDSANELGGDKAGDWKRWYDRNIPIAEARFESWLAT